MSPPAPFCRDPPFAETFESGPEQYATFQNSVPAFMDLLKDMTDVDQLDALRIVKFFVDIQDGGHDIDFKACVCIGP